MRGRIRLSSNFLRRLVDRNRYAERQPLEGPVTPLRFGIRAVGPLNVHVRRLVTLRRTAISASAMVALALALPCALEPPLASRSAALAGALKRLMQEHDLAHAAVAEPGIEDRFAATHLSPGRLLVVTARHPHPVWLRARVRSRDAAAVFDELVHVVDARHKVFVRDADADGIQLAPLATRPADAICGSKGSCLCLDGDWGRQGLSEREYRERFVAADRRYTQLLALLIAQVKIIASSRVR
jgi:hypothetical protein